MDPSSLTDRELVEWFREYEGPPDSDEAFGLYLEAIHRWGFETMIRHRDGDTLGACRHLEDVKIAVEGAWEYADQKLAEAKA